MSLSFEDSLKKAAEESVVTIDEELLAGGTANEEIAVMSLAAQPASMEDISMASVLSEEDSIMAYAGDDWIRDDKYLFYTDYEDNNISEIDDNKNVKVNQKQINLTQETNSQFIPFQMPRFYDGFDLTSTSIIIHFVNKDGYEDRTAAVNVYYNNDKIKFGWLVKKTATAVEGKLNFEIEAIGTNSKGEEYIWKTKPNGELNVLKSLSGNGMVEPDETWVTSFLTQVTEQVSIAQAAAQEAQGAISTVQGYADDAAASAEQAKITVDTAKTELEASVDTAVNNKVTNALLNYYTKPEVDTLIANIDISDQLDEVKEQINNLDGLANFDVRYDGTTMTFYNGDAVMKEIQINSDPSEEWTADFRKEFDDKFASIEEEIGDLPETLKNDYYPKTEIDTKFATKEEFNVVKTSSDTNKGNISLLSDKVTDIEGEMSKIDTSPRLTYDVKYNDAEDPDNGENTFTLYEIKYEGLEGEVREVKQKFVIVGGGGGGTSSSLKIEYITKSPIVATVDDKVIIQYRFTGTDSSGDEVSEGNAVWKVAGRTVASNIAIAGDNEFDITEHIALGSQKVTLSITDDAGSLVTKSWTVQKIDFRIESKFNDDLTYPIGEVSLDYTPYGSISKDIHFILDGKEIDTVTTSSSGIPTSYTIPAQTHGSHLAEVYMTATINNNTVTSNRIYKDILWYDATTGIPVIGCTTQKFTARQYDSTNIEYTVFDPSTESPVVEIAVDGIVVSTQTLTTSVNTYSFKTNDPGEHEITISCGETVKTIKATITELDIDVSPVTAGLVFDFNPVGKSNSDTDRLWSDGDIAMSVSDNFDWVNGGYQYDENGDQYFCIKSGTTATINYNLFADDAKVNGKEFKVIFKTTNIKNRDSSFISCMDGGIGLDMKVESANIYSSNGSLYSPYCEEDIIEFEFNINRNTDIPMVLTYEDGVGNRPMIYTADSSFWQAEPQPITIGNENCDVHIYRMKAYSSSLSDRDILSNFIADARNAEDMLKRYDRNQIYQEGVLTPQYLAEKCPDLRIIMLDAPWFTNDKDNKVSDTNITMIYKNGDAILDNWTCAGATHRGQGTSSNEYGYAARNIDLVMDTDTSLFTLGDGKTTSSTITLTRDSVPTDYLNCKVNVASSEMENNAENARDYSLFNPFIRFARWKDSKVKDCMEFFNGVIFVRERNEDISTHREFQDTNYHFYSLCNVGDSKKTDDTRVNDKNDPKEYVVEITDYNVPLAEFPTGTDGICPVEEWKPGNTAYDFLYSDYTYEDGEFKAFGAESYEFRYEMKKITDEQRQANIDTWREMYKFIVTSTDEEFYSRLKEWFVVDSVLYYYLFTENRIMVDNRAKNLFVHYGKVYISSEEALTLGDDAGGYIIDDVQAAIRDGYRYDMAFGYDFDTSYGIGNTGKLNIPYGSEDVDFYVDGDPESGYIYRAAKSTFFCRLRDLFKSEMQAMYVDRENVNAWSASRTIKQWDDSQNQFPEELFRLHYQRLYMRTYQGISIDNSIPGEANPRFLEEMMNGRKKYQRRMFMRNNELYFATKYFGKVATQDQIMMRFNNPVGATVPTDFTLYITPYSNMYIGTSFGNVAPTNFRAKAGIEYTVPCSIESGTADITLIYGASFIQAIGDLSKCYVGDNDFSKASRLQSLSIGSDAEGYANSFMTKISLGNNKLLEYLDIRNTPAINSVVDLSQCNNMLELRAEGSGATGVIFANGGKIKKAYLPAITSLTMKNLNYLEEFIVDSYDKLQTLVIEHTPFIDSNEIVESSPVLRVLRLIGLNWSIEDTDILKRILTMRGINNIGGEIEKSVLTGDLFVPVVRQQELKEYNDTWQDLEITYNTMVEQFPVTFVNEDGTILDVQYVDKGGDAVDPLTREDNPIATPTKESTISHDFTFAGWDSVLTSIFEPRTITATYSESLRSYTIKYVAMGYKDPLQTSTGLYGENIVYEGSTPTYTAEEDAYKFYLFNRWDKSGIIDGDKTVNAIFDSFTYTPSAFEGKELKDMTPVEVYALTKLGVENTTADVQDGDDFSFEMGYDVDFDDIESELIISETKLFNGSNHIDTGIKLFDEDKDFVLAVDYKFSSENSLNNVLAQCFQSNGSNGFKLWYNNGAKFDWGSSSTSAATNSREMIVIRHKKGDNNLIVYNSNLDTETFTKIELTRNKSTIADSTLVFGCTKADDGAYENHAVGSIYWAKVWYMDLGEKACEKLAGWTHEKITMEVCGFKRFYLSDNPTKRCALSLLATHLLDKNRQFNSAYTNTGGWEMSNLNSFLNNRFYDAIPDQIKLMIKKVNISSSIGNMSTDISQSPCYVTIPAVVELVAEAKGNSEIMVSPYIQEGQIISYMTSAEMRKRAYIDGGYNAYWTRSPNVGYPAYIYQINDEGNINGYAGANNRAGVLIMISM